MKFSEDLVIDANRFLVEFYSGKDVIALHAYGKDKNNQLYYETALTYFDENAPVIVFTDDLDWYETSYLFSGDRFTASEGNNIDFDLCLTMHCDAHIIGNNENSLNAVLNSKSKLIIVPNNVNFQHKNCLKLEVINDD